ncbi:MAG: hypothetical protein WCD79_03645, partial [Chthoniobacteraceae bacterium]
MTSAIDDGSPGSLSWAITQANADPGSTINLADNLGAITLAGALPIITSAVTINGGAGDSISGNNQYRIFFVDTTTPGAAVNINNVSLVNGVATGGAGANGGGGGLGAGGALFVNSGHVTISGITFANNAAIGGAGGNGGA